MNLHFTHWQQTYTGRVMVPANPTVDMIDIEDIAHALSLQCRFAGHIKQFYSVAEHALRVSYSVPIQAAMYGLLHDGAEAYTVDIPTPIKRQLTGFQPIEDRLMEAIIAKFNVALSPEIRLQVKSADEFMLREEAKALLNHPEMLKHWEPVGLDYDHALMNYNHLPIRPMTSEHAKTAFLARYRALLQINEVFV